MAKRIERSRIESGKVDLPRKLHFLVGERVDFLALIERDGEYSVELPVSALKRLVKAKGDLKALKGEEKSAAASRASALQTEKEAHAGTQSALAKAERRVKALTKKLEEASAPQSGRGMAAANDRTARAAPKAKNAAQPNGRSESMEPDSAQGSGAGSDAGGAPLTVEAAVPKAPKKVSPKKVTAKAAEEVLAPAEPAALAATALAGQAKS